MCQMDAGSEVINCGALQVNFAAAQHESEIRLQINKIQYRFTLNNDAGASGSDFCTGSPQR